MKRKKLFAYLFVILVLVAGVYLYKLDRLSTDSRAEAYNQQALISQRRRQRLKKTKSRPVAKKEVGKKKNPEPVQDQSLIPRDKAHLICKQEANHRPLAIPTYVRDNNHCLHPSVLYDGAGTFGYPWIMAFTPYSFMKDETENPSLVVSQDGINWQVPEGLANPLVDSKLPKGCHYSDTELLMVHGQLELWYRKTNKDLGQSCLLRRTSTDLIHWSQEEVIFDFGQGDNGFIAPSVIYDEAGKEYRLYYRNHANLNREGYVLRKSQDLKNWSDEEEVIFNMGPDWQDYFGWHVEFDRLGDQYYALNMAFPNMKGRDGCLFALDSKDGRVFDHALMIEKPAPFTFKSRSIYKSSFAWKDGEIYLYYSAIGEYKENYIALLKGPDFYHLKKVDGPQGHR